MKEILLTWNDPETEAIGWLVINSLKGGAAGGGTLMKIDLEMDELLIKAKMMELKYDITGLKIGGAQGGIRFNPDDPRKNEVLSRWYKAMGPLLKTYYGTYGGENINLIKDIIPNTENIGIWHPYEGILTGHYDLDQPQKINRIGQLRRGTSLVLENNINISETNKKYKLLDSVCGYGIAESVKHYYNLRNDSLSGRKVLIQGLGVNSFYTAFHLMRNGAEIKGFIDEDQLLFKPEGFTENELQLINESKDYKKLTAETSITIAKLSELIDFISVDILIINTSLNNFAEKHIEKLFNMGLGVIVCGVDNVFSNDYSIYGDKMQQIDQYLSIIPSFIATLGLPRFLTFLMEKDIVLKEEIILNDISNTIKLILQDIFNKNPSKCLLQMTALEIIQNKNSLTTLSQDRSLVSTPI